MSIRITPASAQQSGGEAPTSGRVSFNLDHDNVDDNYINDLRAMQQQQIEPDDTPEFTLDAMNEFIHRGTPARPGGSPEQQQQIVQEQQMSGVLSADELAAMFNDDDNESGASDGEKPIQEQLIEFNNMITTEVAKVNYITPELSQKIISAMSGNDPKGTENFVAGMNEAMRNVAVNSLNTAFSMLQHHVQKAVQTAVSKANTSRDFDANFSELLRDMPPAFSADPIRTAFLQKTMRDFSRKAPDLKTAARMTKAFINSMLDGKGSNKSATPSNMPARMQMSNKMLNLSNVSRNRRNDFGSMFTGG